VKQNPKFYHDNQAFVKENVYLYCILSNLMNVSTFLLVMSNKNDGIFNLIFVLVYAGSGSGQTQNIESNMSVLCPLGWK